MAMHNLLKKFIKQYAFSFMNAGYVRNSFVIMVTIFLVSTQLPTNSSFFEKKQFNINSLMGELPKITTMNANETANVDNSAKKWQGGQEAPLMYWKADSYDELVNWYLWLEENYSDYIEVFKANELYGLGKVDGIYDMYYVRITNESLGFHKPEVLFIGSPHGDETVGTNCLYWFADWLMRYAYHPDFDNPQRKWLRYLIDHREIYIVVCQNPYGFDHVQRRDSHGWDLNREADYDGPGDDVPYVWASINGKTLERFIANHTIRVASDMHGGTRMLLYPWSSTHDNVHAWSPISGEDYWYAPPDFYFYDAVGLRLGDYIGDYGGDLNENNIGPAGELLWYPAYGCYMSWGYAADVERNTAEDQYVDDETYGNYYGARIFWLSPEISSTKNPPQSTFGNDTTWGWGIDVRHFLLHQIDIAQPYVRWISAPENDIEVMPGTTLTFKWQVNGSLVVDHTYIQWGTDPDPINNSEYNTTDHDEHAGDYYGGTGWDNADNGTTQGVIYVENITIDTPGDYYFVAKAQVDQVYADRVAPGVYGNHSYLRMLEERINESYYEEINGTDGLEVIRGRLWWYSPIIHVKVVNPDTSPPVILMIEKNPRGIIRPGDWVNITCEISDNWEIGDVRINITNPRGVWTNESMQMLRGDETNALYYYNTTYEHAGVYEFYIWTNDTNGNSARSETQTIFIFGTDVLPPGIRDVVIIPDEQTSGGYVNISCLAYDDIGLKQVRVNITYPNGSYINQSMNFLHGYRWRAYFYYNNTYSMPGMYNVAIWAIDGNDNQAIATGYKFIIT